MSSPARRQAFAPGIFRLGAFEILNRGQAWSIARATRFADRGAASIPHLRLSAYAPTKCTRPSGSLMRAQNRGRRGRVVREEVGEDWALRGPRGRHGHLRALPGRHRAHEPVRLHRLLAPRLAVAYAHAAVAALDAGHGTTEAHALAQARGE